MSEQDLYLKEFYNDYFIEQIEFNGDGFVWVDSKARSDLDECNHGWEAWQASANRQGYKLVPVEDLHQIHDELAEEHPNYHLIFSILQKYLG